jgi:hypothetical protein
MQKKMTFLMSISGAQLRVALPLIDMCTSNRPLVNTWIVNKFPNHLFAFRNTLLNFE